MAPRGKRKSSAISQATPDAIEEPAAIPSKRRAALGKAIHNLAREPNTDAPIANGIDEAAVVNGLATKAPTPKRRTKAERAAEGVVPATEPPGTGNKQPNGTSEEVTRAVDDSAGDPETEATGPSAEEDVAEALSRPPPVHSDRLPLPWKGRLGFACLNTYLRSSNPPVFSSRTCRIQSILDHRHPLIHPDQPEHATKNRPDKTKPADVRRGQKYVEEVGLANARDIPKMVRWNERYGIKFMRLSSEMFPFASHIDYGYKLAPFAADALAEAGAVAGELGHRLTTHPGQFTQLGSPRKVVVDNAIRDLEYHAELLSLLKLPPQQDRDAVMILHMGGTFGSKEETLDRFRANYATLPEGVKKRLVLENDDVSWHVHDLLPICEELNIPMVLDFHHHNILFDASKVREGTQDIIALYPRIVKTWARKGITPKMHYSEPTAAAITPRQRRKHSPRVATLPPCPNDMDLMIEAKDKEQAVFELMRTFKLPGYEKFNNITPFIRDDETRMAKPYTKKELKERAAAEVRGETLSERKDCVVPADEVGMGGPLGRVYWPPGMEEWLRPEKVGKPKAEPSSKDATPRKAINGIKAEEEAGDAEDVETSAKTTSAKGKAGQLPTKAAAAVSTKSTPARVKTATPRKTPTKQKAVATIKAESESAASDDMSDESASDTLPDLSSGEEESHSVPFPPTRATIRRGAKANGVTNGAGKPGAKATRPSRGRARVSYAEEEGVD